MYPLGLDSSGSFGRLCISVVTLCDGGGEVVPLMRSKSYSNPWVEDRIQLEPTRS